MRNFFILLTLLMPFFASAEDPKPATPAAAAMPSTEAKAPETKAAEPKKESAALTLDVGKAKFGMLLQTWAIWDGTPTASKQNFRIRRAEIKFSGTLNESAKWFLMIDPAKSLRTGAITATNDNKVLQDLGMVYVLNEQIEFTTGQFKAPTVAEGLDSSGDLAMPERSLVARTYGDKRQIGFQAAYKEAKWKATAMISNGGNPNTDDTNTAKDLSVRTEYLPFANFSCGAFAAANEFSFSENGKWGLNAKWKSAKELVRFELVQAADTVAGVKTKSKGYVAELGYFVLDELQPMFRLERYYPDTTSLTSAKAVHLGLNYFFQKNNHKLQLAYSRLNRMKGSNGSYTSDLTLGADRMIVVAYQMSF